MANVGVSSKGSGATGGTGSTGGPDTVSSELSKDVTTFDNDAALFSYSRDIRFSVDQWLAQGVLGYAQDIPINMPPLFKRDTLHSLLFAEFSRVDVGGNVQRIEKTFNVKSISSQINGSESNSLILGAALWGRLPPHIPGFEGLIFQVMALDRTDFDFHSQIPDGEFELEPDIGWLGIGSANTLLFNKYLAWKFDPSLHLDAGYVFDAGPWSKSNRGDNFIHLGPKLQLTLWPLYGFWPFLDNPLTITGTFAQV